MDILIIFDQIKLFGVPLWIDYASLQMAILLKLRLQSLEKNIIFFYLQITKYLVGLFIQNSHNGGHKYKLNYLFPCKQLPMQ